MVDEMSRCARVCIVDDDPIVSCGVQFMCQKNELEWLGGSSSVKELLSLDVLMSGDVVLLDMQLQDGSEAHENVVALHAAGARTIVFTSGIDLRLVRGAVAAGTWGILNKNESLATVCEAIKQVAGGEVLASGVWAEAVLADWEICDQLSDKHQSILREYSLGVPAKHVAKKLQTPKNTVNAYMQQVRDMLAEKHIKVENRVDVYLAAIRFGLISPSNAR
ncbi:DNA-binding response regulator [Buchananella hordeovulneris]|uniref:Response regulatory domain-containing protein n=1 Tax=Buchananella hordeovulneris TaxID=52770 RepID=A0A1Q5PTG1_9ACTO|nr:response regulator [Buchananella hordeovulneris]OKL50863.1 hypothetical protein BSZ40_10550 [Buchananella hordeovulneris]